MSAASCNIRELYPVHWQRRLLHGTRRALAIDGDGPIVTASRVRFCLRYEGVGGFPLIGTALLAGFTHAARLGTCLVGGPGGALSRGADGAQALSTVALVRRARWLVTVVNSAFGHRGRRFLASCRGRDSGLTRLRGEVREPGSTIGQAARHPRTMRPDVAATVVGGAGPAADAASHSSPLPAGFTVQSLRPGFYRRCYFVPELQVPRVRPRRRSPVRQVDR